jgi:hypothetical protein
MRNNKHDKQQSAASHLSCQEVASEKKVLDKACELAHSVAEGEVC